MPNKSNNLPVLSPDAPARMLFARLQLADSAARSFLITSVRGEASVGTIAEQLRIAIEKAGHKATIVERPRSAVSRGEAATDTTYEIVVAPGLLADGHTLVLAAEADISVLVVQRGRTVRRELETARRELVSAGGRLAVAVLLE